MYLPPKTAPFGLAALTAVSLLLSGCATGGDPTTPDSAGQGAAGGTETRLAVAYPGGISVLDGRSLEVVGEFPAEDFARLNPAGDGRHVVVTTAAGFQLLDMLEPRLTELVVPAGAAGHVMHHADSTVLFDDSSGESTIFDTSALTELADTLPPSVTYTAPEAHHGLSLMLHDGTLLTTRGDASGRTGAMALTAHDGHWDETAASDECPGIHGAGIAAQETVVFGCEDGALLHTSAGFQKLQSPDTFGRMGNVFADAGSTIVVGDYRNDPDTEGYLLDAVALLDVGAASHRVLSLPESIRYSFRGIARGEQGLAYLLSTNGSLHVLDPHSGRFVNEFPVIAPWEGPREWQDAHPALTVQGNIGYVSEPSRNSVHTVDLTTGALLGSRELAAAPHELALSPR